MERELFEKATDAVRLYYLNGMMSNKKDVVEFFKAKGLENQISFMIGRFGDYSKMIMI